jgi:hypothetical protein
MSRPPECAATFFKTWMSILVGHLGLQSVTYRVDTPCISGTGYRIDQLDCDYSSKADEAKLPTAMEGLSKPLIIFFNSTHSSFPSANTIDDYLVTKYNVEKYSTTVIRTERWSTIIGPKGHYAIEPKNMQGIENECIIYVASARELEDTSPLDVVTRARNGLIIVINCDEKITMIMLFGKKLLKEP